MNTAASPACTVSPEAASRAFRHQLVLMATLGTFVPLAVLSLLYTLAPLPLTAQAASMLRAANGIAAVVIGLNALAVAALALARTWFMRRGLVRPAVWQPVPVVGRSESA
jgi:hypothetical protein